MPTNPTSAQSQTSRLNGTHSTGPKTEDGKARSAQNATSHGLRSERFDLRDDEKYFAAELRHGLVARVMPVDTAERGIVEALVVCEIKLARLDQLEMRVLDLALDDEAEEPSRRLPSLATLDRYRGRIMRERRELESRLEALKASRSKLTSKSTMPPEALRYLAELAERKMAEKATQTQPEPANDDQCTKEPEMASRSMGIANPSDETYFRTNKPEHGSHPSH